MGSRGGVAHGRSLADSDAPVLEAVDLCAGYGRVPAVHDLNLTVRPGEIVALLGANGAGKTTALKSLAGELKPISGRVRRDGDHSRAKLHHLATRGQAYVSEERSVFLSLTCQENLSLGRGSIADALVWMPELEPLLSRRAGLLSGGEQQMLTLARALAAKPRLLLVDEISHGLAPIIVLRLLASIRDAADQGAAVVLVEQQVRPALRLCDRAIVLQRGRTVVRGSGVELLADFQSVQDAYLASGVSEALTAADKP